MVSQLFDDNIFIFVLIAQIVKTILCNINDRFS
jgi:hypothetical protein